ncbi:putative UBX domain-containing protein 2/7 [Medicago truncatula]|uniref:Putative UBX domain-containing protein 2/7 n=1 Tax=Medicago truncatula TaxID=3880 RepID=A0A396I4Q5_MEDTR|nr:putative UBX domain-containing protein 2/7 [Medicago truncatula]
MMLSSSEKTSVSIFLEIARGATAATAKHFLESTSWNVEEALEWYLSGDYDDSIMCGDDDAPETVAEQEEPIKFKKETTTTRRRSVCESDLGAAAASTTVAETEDNLASLYRPPTHLMFNASFKKAKCAASMQNKWLLVNIQSTKEFNSLMLNRDTWTNDAVSQIITTNFIFLQVYDDTTKGKKLCTYYKLNSIPVVLIIHPITGQNMHSWEGLVQPQTLLEGLLTFLDATPKDHHNTLSHKSPPGTSTPPDTEGLLTFLYHPLLWSFIAVQLKEDETKPFKLTHEIHGASKNLDYRSNATFEESGLAGSMISVTWD